MGSAWGFWKVRKFLSEPEEAPTHSRTTVPARDTGVTPGRAGRAFVPGAVLENVWSRESARCLSRAPAASWQESWESPAKNQGESREQGHAGICTGRRGAGGKTGFQGMIFTSSSALRGLLQPAPLLGSVPGTSRGTHLPLGTGREEEPVELHLGASQEQPQE